MTNPVSAVHWLPRMQHSEIPMPMTAILPYNHNVCIGIEDAPGSETYESAVEELNRCALAVDDALHDRIGYPAFVRTDLSSAKHDGPKSYRIDDAPDIAPRLVATVVDNELKFGLGGPVPQAFLVRQWLTLLSPFSAFGGHPIAREWRYFVTKDGVSCSHFYWPSEAILTPDHDDWEFRLFVLEESSPPPADLEDWANEAMDLMGDTVPGWSVDFAQDTELHWWLIDMAPADVSWHPEHAA